MNTGKKNKIIYILSNIDKALAFEWIASCLDKEKFSLSFILLNPGPSHLEKFLIQHGIIVNRITYRGKKDLPKALFQTIRFLKAEKPYVIHCHLFDASLVGLLAGRICGIEKCIYTRHHSSLHHIYFPRAVYYDKIINLLATDIIAISGKGREILVQQENVDPAKIRLIPHGFKLDDFNQVSSERQSAVKKKYNLGNLRPVIGSIARYTHWKGIQYTIEAFKLVLKDFPDALLILANASGDYKPQIRQLLRDVPARNYHEIVFEPDVMALYHLFDIYVHVPIDDHSEAFGQTYVEALAAGVPSVFTLSGVASEFVQEQKNALVVPFQDADAIYNAILRLLDDEFLRTALITQGKQDVSSNFGLSKMIKSLEDIYAG